MSDISQLQINGITYDIADATARNNYLPLSGGTLTDKLYMQNADVDIIANNIDRDATTYPSALTSSTGVGLLDKDQERIGTICVDQDASRMILKLGAHAETTENAETSTWLSIVNPRNGTDTGSIVLSDGADLRFGYGQMLHGYTTSIYMGSDFSSLASGDIQWRFLNSDGSIRYRVHDGTHWGGWQYPPIPASAVTSGTFDAARIPNIAASKITGTLGVNHGGTGQTAVTTTTGTSLVTESTAADVTACSLSKWGPLACLSVTFTPKSSWAANASLTIGNIKDDVNKPKTQVGGGASGISAGVGTTGNIYARNNTGAARTDSTTVGFVYLLK